VGSVATARWYTRRRRSRSPRQLEAERARVAAQTGPARFLAIQLGTGAETVIRWLAACRTRVRISVNAANGATVMAAGRK